MPKQSDIFFAGGAGAISQPVVETLEIDMSLNATFTSGTMYLTKVANTVTIVGTGAGHASTNGPVGTGIIPEGWRPVAIAANEYKNNSSIVRWCRVETNGDLYFSYRTWAGGNVSDTTTEFWTLSYNTADPATELVSTLSENTYTKIRAYLGSNQSIPSNTETVVALNSTDFDSLGEWNTSTYRFTPIESGYYQINTKVRWENLTTVTAFMGIYLRKNGSIRVEYDQKLLANSGDDPTQSQTSLLYLNKGDYLEFTCQQNDGASRDITSSSSYTRILINRVPL